MSLHHFSGVFLGCRFDFLGIAVRASLQTCTLLALASTLLAAHSVSPSGHLALASANPNCKVLILQLFPCLFATAHAISLPL